jgi:hypothetical protein
MRPPNSDMRGRIEPVRHTPSPRLLSMPEATERLVGSAVFKTVEGSQDPWRVRFPSASATNSSQPSGTGRFRSSAINRLEDGLIGVRVFSIPAQWANPRGVVDTHPDRTCRP